MSRSVPKLEVSVEHIVARRVTLGDIHVVLYMSPSDSFGGWVR